MRDLIAMAAALQSALKSVLPGDTTITAIRPLATGFSNETYIIDGPDLILRLPPAGGVLLEGHDVPAQGAIYAALGTTVGAPPVPQVVLASSDTDLLGVPFFVMARAPGESLHDLDMQAWFTSASDDVRMAMCRDWIGAIARLGNLAPLAILGEPATPDGDARIWRDFAHEAKCPELVSAYDRLLAHPAPRSGVAAVIHGDPKLSNMMWDDFRLSAVLDWEMSLNGDPLSDLAYMLLFFASPFHDATRAPKQPGMMTRDQVIAQWCDTTGRSADGLIWHEAAQVAKICAIIAQGIAMYEKGLSQDPKFLTFQATFTYYMRVLTATLDAF